MSKKNDDFTGRRVLITGAARGVGSLLAKRLHDRGARVALAGIEAEEMAKVARACGDAPTFACDVTDRAHVDAAVAGAVEALGGLDVAVANAGIAAQLPLVGGDPTIFERTIAVNLVGMYYLARAAGEHLSHPGGYLLITASAAAAAHPPLMGAYNASKAGAEALGNTLRCELGPYGCKVGVSYYAELATDMVDRGFGTEAAKSISGASVTKVYPVEGAIDALERGIARRSRRIVYPSWVGGLLHVRMIAQRGIELQTRKGLRRALDIAREEKVELTTPQE